MNAREFADRVGRPHGTVKRWLRQKNNPLPHRMYGNIVVIDLKEATRWLEAHDRNAGGRARNRVTRTR